MMNLILIGPPGAGKGTQSDLLVQHYQLKHISPGALLREQVQQGTELGKQVAQSLASGKLLNDTLVADLVAEQFKHRPADCEGFLLDGFPRAMGQIRLLEERLTQQQLSIDLVILLEIPEEVILQRLQERAKQLNRADDQDAEKIATRLRVYQQENLPVAAYYAQKGTLCKIHGVGEVAEIFNQIRAQVDLLLTKASLQQ